MPRLLLSIFLIMFSIIPSFGRDYRQHRQNYQNHHGHYVGHNYYGYGNQYNRYDRGNNRGMSATTGIIIGLGAGVVGYVAGRSTRSSNVDQETETFNEERSKPTKIECKYFDLAIVDDGKTKIVKVQKCRANKGPWLIPE